MEPKKDPKVRLSLSNITILNYLAGFFTNSFIVFAVTNNIYWLVCACIIYGMHIQQWKMARKFDQIFNLHYNPKVLKK